MKKVSLIMIAKNEEGGLERAVKSAKDIVDEVIIGVDKNSTDKTLEIAKRIADVCYEYEWTGDFAAARNTYMGKATGDWVLQLDGHEYIKKYQDIDWEETAKHGDGVRVQVQMEDGAILRANRIFKNGIKYLSKVHNYPDVKKVVIDPEFLIKHDRFVQTNEVLGVREKQRDKMIMENMGSEKNIRSLYYTARQHADMKRYDEAIEIYKEYFKATDTEKKTEPQIAERRKVRYDLAKVYYKNKDYKRAIRELDKEDLMEYMFLKGQIHAMEEQHARAIPEFMRAFITKPTGEGFQPIADIEFQLWDFLSVSLYKLAQYEMAYTATQKALEYKDDEQVKNNARVFAHYFRAVKEKGSDYYDQLFKNGYDTTRYKDIYEIIMRTLNKNKKSEVLELACGVGSLGKLIIDAGFKYRGFDFSKNAIKHSKKLCPKGNFYVGDVYDKKEYGGNYDTIIATELLEHVDDLKVLELIPSGVKLIASVPNFGDVAHLRTYESEEFIEKRFRKYLNIENIYFSKERGIYVFEGIKK